MISRRRQKGLFAFVILSSCLIYLNWLVNINDWSYTNSSISKEIRDMGKRNNKHEFVNFNEYIDASHNLVDRGVARGEENNFNINFKNKVILLAAKEDGAEYYKESNDKNENLDQNDLSVIFDILYRQKAFLVDTNILNELQSVTKSAKEFLPGFKNKIKTFDLIKQFYENSNIETLLTYGIFLNTFENLNKNLVNNLTPKCHLSVESVSTDGKKIVSNMYIVCQQLTIQISVFHDRSSFLWIGSDNYPVNKAKIFGDKPRAMNKFELNQVIDDEKNQFLVPSNIEKFLFDYSHSSFLECNRELAAKNLERLGASYEPDEKRNKMISPVVRHLTSTLESFGKQYWLAGGTLLGWYRDCGIIPHTQDVDLAIWADEYDSRIKEHFLGNKIVRVWGTLGLLNDSFEFRLYNDKFTFDMFLVYKINSTHQWCGYQVNRVKFRRFLPYFDELCSGELLGQKLMIPCNPVKYLDNEYGVDNWAVPKSKNYTWKNVVYSKNWTNTEWPYAVRYYDKKGKLLQKKTLTYLNQHLQEKIESLPEDGVN